MLRSNRYRESRTWLATAVAVEGDAVAGVGRPVLGGVEGEVAVGDPTSSSHRRRGRGKRRRALVLADLIQRGGGLGELDAEGRAGAALFRAG